MNKNYNVEEVFEEVIDLFNKEDILELREKINIYIREIYKL